MIKQKWIKWTEDEEIIFQKALKEFGKDFQAVSDLLKGRTYRQVRSHYYNFQQSLKKRNSSENIQYQLICYDNE
ncbi:SANT/Myb_domain [Hexamita inflata]|uniref:SANT/Myb domain n=1 Tax=Hexamita inflata TaxID=28002 RepID=A0AA86NGM8_9EUKA|nr:SANT/Myb domain [Hexamita inflata]